MKTHLEYATCFIMLANEIGLQLLHPHYMHRINSHLKSHNCPNLCDKKDRYHIKHNWSLILWWHQMWKEHRKAIFTNNYVALSRSKHLPAQASKTMSMRSSDVELPYRTANCMERSFWALAYHFHQRSLEGLFRISKHQLLFCCIFRKRRCLYWRVLGLTAWRKSGSVKWYRKGPTPFLKAYKHRRVHMCSSIRVGKIFQDRHTTVRTR